MKEKLQLLVNKYPKLLGEARIEIPEAWYKPVEDLCHSIQGYIDNSKTYIDGKPVFIPQVKCIQIKQKLGTFRFYIDIQEPTINGMIKLASYICENTCEHCGSREDIGYSTGGWITVCCKECSSKFEKWINKTDVYAPTIN